MILDLFVVFEILFLLMVSAHSPTQDSPKKARAKEPLTPSKISKTARQLIFDAAVYYRFLLLNLVN